MIDFGNQSGRCLAFSVDPDTWGDGERVGPILEASVTRDLDSELLQTGTISVEGEEPQGYIRIIWEALSEGDAERVEVATLYVATTIVTRARERALYECELYSVLRPAACRLLPIGWHFPQGGDLVSGALDLLRTAVAAPVENCDEEVYASESIVAEEGETALTMAQLLLSEAGFHIDIDGHGKVCAVRDGEGREADIDEGPSDHITGDVSDTLDLYDVPNTVIATDGEGEWAEAVNDDAGSPTSVEAVGFPVMRIESVSGDSGTSLLEAAQALLDEESATAREISYTRTYDGLRPGDTRHMNLPSVGLVGDFVIQSQDIDLATGAQVSETVRQRVDAYRR